MRPKNWSALREWEGTHPLDPNDLPDETDIRAWNLIPADTIQGAMWKGQISVAEMGQLFFMLKHWSALGNIAHNMFRIADSLEAIVKHFAASSQQDAEQEKAFASEQTHAQTSEKTSAHLAQKLILVSGTISVELSDNFRSQIATNDPLCLTKDRVELALGSDNQGFGLQVDGREDRHVDTDIKRY